MRKILAFACMFTFSCCVFAAEIVGTITDRGRGAQNARVTVTCDGFEDTAITSISGQYRIKNVPDGRACNLVIWYKSGSTEPHSFETTSGRMPFNHKIR